MIKTTLTAVALALTVVSTAHAKDKKPQLPTLALGAWCESTGYHRPEDARLFERGKCIEKLVLGQDSILEDELSCKTTKIEAPIPIERLPEGEVSRAPTTGWFIHSTCRTGDSEWNEKFQLWIGDDGSSIMIRSEWSGPDRIVR